MGSRQAADTGRGEGGFALLVSLVAIVGLTALATGGFLLASSERRVSSNHHAAVEAFYLADAGLNDYLANQSGTPPDGPVTYGPYGYPDGAASVSVARVATTGGTGDPGVYRVTSRGSYDPEGTGNPVRRTVSALALLDRRVVPPIPAAYTSAGGVGKDGGSGEIDGDDACGEETARAGVRVPLDGYRQVGDGDLVDGEPPVEETPRPLDLDGDGSTVDEAEWWAGMLDGTGIEHDYVIEGADASWPEIAAGEMPVTFVDRERTSLGSGASGRGILILRGDAVLGGGFEWDGIVLVGGSLTDDGSGGIEGAVMTGLNELQGESVAEDDLGADRDAVEGATTFLYHSCYVNEALDGSALLAELPGTWHERI